MHPPWRAVPGANVGRRPSLAVSGQETHLRKFSPLPGISLLPADGDAMGRGDAEYDRAGQGQ